ncbi:MAG: hypothetical protein DSY80_05405 [Desulfocapsa sp.]|nr:MAG: hypothetical protein DSY80_05405 [Desulfocapsa sp.]
MSKKKIEVFNFRGKTMSRSQIAKRFDLPKYIVLKATKQRSYKQALEDVLWKKERGYKLSQKVFRKDGHRECADSVKEASGCSHRVAIGRINRWMHGGTSYASLIREPGAGKIYAKDGKEVTVKEVQEKTNRKYKAANARIQLWLEGTLTYEELFEPTKVTFVKDPGGGLRKKSKANANKLLVGSQGVRRAPEDLKVGSWEKEHIQGPGNFCSGGRGSHTVAVDSSGVTHLSGD